MNNPSISETRPRWLMRAATVICVIASVLFLSVVVLTPLWRHFGILKLVVQLLYGAVSAMALTGLVGVLSTRNAQWLHLPLAAAAMAAVAIFFCHSEFNLQLHWGQ